MTIASGMSSYLSALAAITFCRTVTAMSHLSSAGRQLLCGLHGFIPPNLGWLDVESITTSHLVAF
jgi:hypothetical protein